MLFPTAKFVLIFLPVSLAGFQLFGLFGRKAALAWLAFISLAFYASWRLDFVPLLLGSIAFNYLCATLIAKTAERPRLSRNILIAGIAGNLGLLVFYKYLFPTLAFFHSAGILKHQWAGVILPLGISFFTFTQIGYLIDLCQGQAEGQSPVSYTVFVTFFPHLIAGPILHHKEVMPQLAEERRYRLRLEDVNVGLSWFILGLAKKLLLADTVAPFADAAFAHPHGLSFFAAWSGSLAYAMQLYFDFSGYSDMAIGLARMFSIRFPLNFNSPYKARNIIDFWQRFHMTLTRYVTLYLFNPISLWVTRKRVAAGKKTSKKALATPGGFTSMIAMPMLFVMTLLGIWHGAGLQYVIFGAMHGCYLTVNHAWRTFGPKLPPAAPVWKRRTAHVCAVLLTFVCVIAAQAFFRADSVHDAAGLLRGMAGLNGFALSPSAAALLGHITPAAQSAATWFSSLLQNNAFDKLVLIPILLLIVWAMPNTQEIIERYGDRRIPAELRAAAYSVVLYLLLFRAVHPQNFIYFQF